MAALRETERQRAALIDTHRWLLNAHQGDALQQVRGSGPHRWKPAAVARRRTGLKGPNGEWLSDQQLFDALDEMLKETALQRRLDAQIAETREREAREREQREEWEARVESAKFAQQQRLERLRTAHDPNEQQISERS